jgi:hypothetical protein
MEQPQQVEYHPLIRDLPKRCSARLGGPSAPLTAVG